MKTKWYTLSLNKHLFYLDPIKLQVFHYPIFGIEFMQKFDRNDHFILKECKIRVKIIVAGKTVYVLFDMDSQGNMKDNSENFYLNGDTAKEELIVLKTKENRGE